MARVVRKLDDDFKLEEDADEEEPLTPAEALISAQDYLSRAQKSRKRQTVSGKIVAAPLLGATPPTATPLSETSRNSANYDEQTR